MCFVSAGWWLESHVFCFCWVMAGKPCVLFLLGGGGWIAIISFNVCIFSAGGKRKGDPEKNLPQLVTEQGGGWRALVLGYLHRDAAAEGEGDGGGRGGLQ